MFGSPERICSPCFSQYLFPPFQPSGQEDENTLIKHSSFFVGAHDKVQILPVFPGQIVVGASFSPGTVLCYDNIPLKNWRNKGDYVEVNKESTLIYRNLKNEIIKLDAYRKLLRSFILSQFKLTQRQQHQAIETLRTFSYQRMKAGHSGAKITSTRTLRDQFAKNSGLGVKRIQKFLRIQCVMELIRTKEMESYADLAAFLGYTDQSHLCHEIKKALDMTPNQLNDLMRKNRII